MSYSPPSDYKMKIKSPASVVRSFVLISLIPDFSLMFREIFIYLNARMTFIITLKCVALETIKIYCSDLLMKFFLEFPQSL